jgi:seryl-tRNA synthetase
MSKRKGGAQPGNTNALKFGYFSRRFTPLELSDLEALLSANKLDSFINSFCVQFRRYQEIADGEDTKDALADTLNTTGVAMIRMASALRTNQALSKRQTDVAGMLYQVIEEVFGNALDPRNP